MQFAAILSIQTVEILLLSPDSRKAVNSVVLFTRILDVITQALL